MTFVLFVAEDLDGTVGTSCTGQTGGGEGDNEWRLNTLVGVRIYVNSSSVMAIDAVMRYGVVLHKSRATNANSRIPRSRAIERDDIVCY